MPKFRITQEDINRTKLVEPGSWYNVKILKVYDEPTKKGDSINTNIDMQIVDGNFKGAMLFRTFNEKAPGFVIPFVKALTGREPAPDEEYDLTAAEGRSMKVFVRHREYNGVLYNDVVDFRPMD